MGLLEGTDTYFTLPAGYYAADSLLMLLAFMALNRMQTIETLRNDAPGEWGKLLGLDRVPEVRTLRDKVHIMSHTGKAIVHRLLKGHSIGRIGESHKAAVKLGLKHGEIVEEADYE